MDIKNINLKNTRIIAVDTDPNYSLTYALLNFQGANDSTSSQVINWGYTTL